jgi:two-component system nitrate/nitrite response regulator NarL
MHTSSSKPTPTAIVDPSDLFRAGLIHTFAKSPFRVIISKADLADLPAQLKLGEAESLLIVTLDGIPISEFPRLSLLKQQNQQMCILALSTCFHPEGVMAAVNVGCGGYLIKGEISAAMLLQAIDLILMGHIILPREFTELIKEESFFRETGCSYGNPVLDDPSRQDETGEELPTYLNGLSAREREVLDHLTRGASNKLIARDLHVAEATVKVYVKALLRKIQVQNRTQAAMWAVTNMAAVDNLKDSPHS